MHHVSKHRTRFYFPGEPLIQPNPTSILPADVRRDVEETVGFVPSFLLNAPAAGVQSWWQSMRDFEMSDETTLDPKVKQLIALGVAAQIPCEYCLRFHEENAKLYGASAEEMREAVFMASLTRQGSTILNGARMDMKKFERELEDIVTHAKHEMAAKTGGKTAARGSARAGARERAPTTGGSATRSKATRRR